MKDVNAMASAGPLLDQAGHEHQRLHGRIVLGLGIGDAEFTRRLPAKTKPDQRRKHHTEDKTS